MYLTDYHAHTTISPDARTTITQLCRAAVDAGVQEVCVTDHWNLADQQGVLSLGPLDWTPSLKQWKAARTKFTGQVELRLGVEVGNGLLDPDAVAQTLALPELDFVIGSLHSAGDKYGHVGFYTAAHQVQTREEAVALLEDYVDLTLRLAQSDGYDVLGHINYPLRYLPQEYHLTWEPWWDQLAEALRAAIAQGKGIEVNTTQATADVREWLPYLRLYRDLGGEVLTFGADSHRPHQVGGLIREAREVARSVGFRWVATYKRRVPFFTAL